MTAVRMIALLIGFGVLFGLQFAAGWPWYYAVPAGIACYLAIRAADEWMRGGRRPSV
jgi:hypothetical protein